MKNTKKKEERLPPPTPEPIIRAMEMWGDCGRTGRYSKMSM